MEWISVKDKLPEDDNPILIYTKDIFGCGKISISSKGKSLLEGKFAPNKIDVPITMTNKNEILSNITHWMPLPEPPKA